MLSVVQRALRSHYQFTETTVNVGALGCHLQTTQVNLNDVNNSRQSCTKTREVNGRLRICS